MAGRKSGASLRGAELDSYGTTPSWAQPGDAFAHQIDQWKAAIEPSPTYDNNPLMHLNGLKVHVCRH